MKAPRVAWDLFLAAFAPVAGVTRAKRSRRRADLPFVEFRTLSGDLTSPTVASA